MKPLCNFFFFFFAAADISWKTTDINTLDGKLALVLASPFPVLADAVQMGPWLVLLAPLQTQYLRSAHPSLHLQTHRLLCLEPL